MAGIKHRYIIVKITTQDGRNFKANIKSLIYKQIKDGFGDVVIGMIDTLEVIEFYETLQIAIIKCNLAIHKYLCYTLASLGSANGLNVQFKILFISGILKKAKIAFLQRYGKIHQEAEIKQLAK